ncbi:16S rRNA (guanine1207-N2)-methyltransferase [Paenibacillus cellulosilyticus]|uniref:16S rRNA (Guanine1207-N2)-methyltransferase n=1 Tax=Paenibacillus cellulosilyticus TaxID=375489 RepID=A0A2V2YNP3_9BACL|nr:class I SAM-dependent methyltransferase [Paenibacillus cellulosilyticus]PWV94320.1 16S rRNA (guanine1207-N2)-methyltransferase [Paenibacillus cellulosilyticus]QKS47851.1 class I SAM-dependent methyltransferase [Paenibacillus cellulosilyticus]
MADHYYSRTPGVEHDRRTHQDELRGFRFNYVTDAGVFSKAGVDYGSRVLIDALELDKQDQVLDVGCGYGPIGITAARLADQGHVTMIDINERAVELARENAKLNGVHNVTIVQSDIYEAVRDKRFNAIVTNPPIRAGKMVVHQIFEEGYQLLLPGGSMWVVIQKKQGAPSAEAKLLELFGNVEEVTKDKGYRIFRAIRES